MQITPVKVIRAVMLFAGCAVGLFSISDARAGTSGYGGVQCRSLFNAPQPLYDGVIARNQSNNSVIFVCGATQTGGAIVSSRVTVRDLNAAAQVTCYASATSSSGSGGFLTPSVGSGDAFTGVVSLSLGSTSSFVADGSKNVTCTMPANVAMDGSGVASFTITES